MITQEICPYKPVVKEHRHKNGKPLFAVGSDDHKKAIFENTMAQIYNRADMYEFGQEFRAKGQKGVGIIINFAKYEECEWDGMKCCPIEIWCSTEDSFYLCHPSDLKPV